MTLVMLRSTIRNASLSRASLRAPFSTTPLRFARPRKNPFYSPPVQPAKRRGRPTDPVIPHPINPEDRIALPDRLEWRSFFSAHAKERISVSNEQTAAEAAEAFVPAGSRDKIIIEAFPGPGALTRALLALPKSRIRKLIVLEEYKPYLDYLQPLVDTDPRLVVVPRNGFAWDTYQFIEDSGELNDVIHHPWTNGIHPNLHFISHLPLLTMGEQFLAQIFRCIPEQEWLFKFGRVPLNFILSEPVWRRINNPIDSTSRCKMTVIADATSTIRTAIPPKSMLPYDDHFHPIVSKSSNYSSMPENKRIGTPFVAVDIKPLAKQVIEKGMLEKWDYCLRRLFVVKSTPLKTAISHLAPGAGSLIKMLTKPDLPASERVDVKKTIKALEVHDWALVLKAFDDWPFAPEELMVSDGFIKDDRRLN